MLRIDGLKFRLYPGENYDDRKILARQRLPEREEHTLVGNLLKPGAVFVDIGANVGTYALFAARRGARVLAIEGSSGHGREARLQHRRQRGGQQAGAHSRGAHGGGRRAGPSDIVVVRHQLRLCHGLPAVSLTVRLAHGRRRKFRCVPLADVLDEAGIDPAGRDEDRRGGLRGPGSPALSRSDAAGAVAARGADGNKLQRGPGNGIRARP